MPPSGSLLEIEGGPLVLSAVKLAEDDDALVVRVFNPEATSVSGTLRFWRAPARVVPVTLDEQTRPGEGPPASSGTAVTVNAGPSEIVTLKLYFAPVSVGVDGNVGVVNP